MGQQEIGNLEIFVWEAILVNEITRVRAKNVTPAAISCSYLCKGLIGSGNRHSRALQSGPRKIAQANSSLRHYKIEG